MIPNVGTRILIKKTKVGCKGAEHREGVITDKPSNNGLYAWDPGYNVELNNGSVWRINPDAKIEILSPFGKHLLRDGVIVRRRDDTYAIVIGNNTHSIKGFIRLFDYNDDLTMRLDQPDYDIMAIYTPGGFGSIKDLFKGEYLELIAERPEVKEEVKEMTLEEICKELGYNVKIVKEA